MEKDRLHEVVVRMDLQLMNAQPSDPRSAVIHGVLLCSSAEIHWISDFMRWLEFDDPGFLFEAVAASHVRMNLFLP